MRTVADVETTDREQGSTPRPPRVKREPFATHSESIANATRLASTPEPDLARVSATGPNHPHFAPPSPTDAQVTGEFVLHVDARTPDALDHQLHGAVSAGRGTGPRPDGPSRVCSTTDTRGTRVTVTTGTDGTSGVTKVQKALEPLKIKNTCVGQPCVAQACA